MPWRNCTVETHNLDCRQNSLLVHLFNGTFSILSEEAVLFRPGMAEETWRNCKNQNLLALHSDSTRPSNVQGAQRHNVHQMHHGRQSETPASSWRNQSHRTDKESAFSSVCCHVFSCLLMSSVCSCLCSVLWKQTFQRISYITSLDWASKTSP